VADVGRGVGRGVHVAGVMDVVHVDVMDVAGVMDVVHVARSEGSASL
jgi:hypothetical protein